jgi:GNAT superfamily N-acetyltransferase
MIARAHVEGDLRWATCLTEREHLVARMLFLLAAAEEGNAFIYGSEKEHKTMIFFDEEQYWGYLIWSETRSRASKHRAPVLRQLFLREQFRGKGLGTAIVRTWIEQVALPLATPFGVESPNTRTQRILVRLGHAYFTGDEIIGRTCYFVPSI